MKLKELKGVYPALITPFKKNGDIDEEGFRRNIDYVIEGGVAGIVPCGCTGEAATLRFEEQKKLLQIAVDQADRNRRKVPVIGGSGSNNVNFSSRRAHVFSWKSFCFQLAKISASCFRFYPYR